MPVRFDLEGGLVAAVVTLLVESVFVYAAARIVLDRASFLASVGTVLVGTFASAFVLALVPGAVGIVLGIMAWALVAAAFFRTRWLRGAVIGLVAAVLWVLVVMVVGALLN